MKNKKTIIVLLVVIVFTFFAFLVISKNIESLDIGSKSVSIVTDHSFEFKFIKEVSTNNTDNILVSPYSVKVALNMLKDGTDRESYEQINKVLGNSKTNYINNDSVQVANGIFIKDKYRNEVSNKYIDRLRKEYNSEVIIDPFKGPEKINNWVSKKTDKMIPVLLDSIDSEFVLALVNALAIDVEWEKAFVCDNTKEEDFYKADGKTIKVAMMHDYDSNGKYFETERAKGIILPYKGKKNKKLELIAILPNDDINNYIDKFDDEELKKIDKYKDVPTKISLSLPKFKYEYDLKTFKNNLENMGIKDIFVSGKANLSKMFKANNDYYVSQAIHKTYIELDEKGTKAAAASGFVISKNAAEEEEITHIEFNKPFAYIIRDKKSNEILFFGMMYEPNKWEGSNCDG